MNIINNVKNKKLPGLAGVRTETMKHYSEQLAKPLTYIINKCFVKNVCTYKIENYCPVSRLTVFSKNFEKRNI